MNRAILAWARQPHVQVAANIRRRARMMRARKLRNRRRNRAARVSRRRNFLRQK